jgi:hypothetical protein
MVYKHPLGENLYGLHLNKDCILRKHKVMLVESEKSVMQCDTMFGKDNFTLALCGSNLTKAQIKLLRGLEVNKVILALDKQYQSVGDEEYIRWVKHLNDIAVRLNPYFKVVVILDLDNNLSYKDSPTDRGKDTLLKLINNNVKGV